MTSTQDFAGDPTKLNGTNGNNGNGSEPTVLSLTKSEPKKKNPLIGQLFCSNLRFGLEPSFMEL